MLRLRAPIWAAVGLSLGAAGSGATTVTGHASVTIVSAITASETSPMGFGLVQSNPSGGTINLTPSGSISATNGLSLAGPATPATFTIQGEPSTAVTISFSSGNMLIGSGPAMALIDFSHNAGASPVLDRRGMLTFSVGAALTVGPAQPPGSYSGTYMVTINY